MAEVHPDQRRVLPTLTHRSCALGLAPMTAPRRQLRQLAGGLIGVSALVGLVAIVVRAEAGGDVGRALTGAALFPAAAAYVAHVLAHHESVRQLLARSIPVAAFALWGLVLARSPSSPNRQ